MRNKASLPRNPVAKNLYTFNKPSVVTSKRRSLQSEATLRDAREDASNELVDSESLCFDDDCNGSLNDIGSSSILIDDSEEDEK